MPASSNFGFFTRSIRGRQKVKRNVRRFLRLLPAHKRLDKYEKLFRKRSFHKRIDNDKL